MSAIRHTACLVHVKYFFNNELKTSDVSVCTCENVAIELINEMIVDCIKTNGPSEGIIDEIPEKKQVTIKYDVAKFVMSFETVPICTQANVSFFNKIKEYGCN